MKKGRAVKEWVSRGVFLALAAMPSLPALAADPVPLARNDDDLNNLLDVTAGARPEDYQPLGLHLGAFQALPYLTTALGYDDNPLRLQSGGSGDAVFLVSPGATVNSDWGRHMLDFWGGGTFRRYLGDGADEDTNAFDVGARGRLDVLHSLIVNGQLQLLQSNEDRQDPNFLSGQRTPTPFREFRSTLEAEYKPADFGILGGIIFDRRLYDPSDQIGLPDVSNADRNRKTVTGYGRVLYDYSTGYQTYLEASYNAEDYDRYLDRFGLHRSSHGYTASAGVHFLFSALLTGDVHLGYLEQDYDQAVSPGLKNIAGLNFGGNITWYPAQDWNVSLVAGRDVQDTIFANSSGGDYRYGKLRVNYSLLPDLVLSGGAGYGFILYRGIAPEFSYDFPTVALGAKYYLNRKIAIGIDYQYSGRTVSNPGLDFNDDTIKFTVGLTE